jgi:hypothetical protein
MDRKAFFSRDKTGLILRTFVTSPWQVADRVEMLYQTIYRALEFRFENLRLISRVDVLVWADERYGRADCGETAPALRRRFDRYESTVAIHEVKKADLYCGLLNYGIATQTRAGCDYSVIASSEAYSYWTEETITAMVEAVCCGARAVGVAINELTPSVLEGRLANTFCMWRNVDLLTVGGFDLRAAMIGVEEVIPLARLVEYFGPCLAPILPQGPGVQECRVPDPKTEPDLLARHMTKMSTKFKRQAELLALVGKDPSFLKGGVMPDYCRF